MRGRGLRQKWQSAQWPRGGTSRACHTGMGSYRSEMDLAERELLADALARAGGDVAKCSLSLGMSTRTLYHRLRRLRVDPLAIRRAAAAASAKNCEPTAS